jgi:MarR family transcriptional regulator, lower aerobic nicotinate degradation pathway regulator
MSSDVLDAVLDLRRALTRGGTAAFAETGVGPRQVLLLRELRRGGSMSQVDLARATVMDAVSVQRVLDALERRGWTRRESHPEDRRRNLVSITAEGKRALADLDNAYEGFRTLANAALSPRERSQFCAMAARISVALQNVEATSSRPKV